MVFCRLVEERLFVERVAVGVQGIDPAAALSRGPVDEPDAVE